jgi:cyclopropane-fatty-acyl-phospholipid synthase
VSTLTSSFRDPAIDISVQLLEVVTADYPPRDFAVRFWDGSTWGNADHPRFTFVLKHPEAIRRMVGASELSLGEAYVNDDFDVEGNLEAAFEFGDYLLGHELELREKLHVAGLLLKLSGNGHRGKLGLVPRLHGGLHSKQRDSEAVSYHYNQSNDFYALWLDPRMVYSCAYFPSGDEDLATAQTLKLDYICRKLRLQPGDRLLDLGCGWGGLIQYAAAKFGVHAKGITLSEPQANLAQARIQEAGLTERCEVQVCDYRDLPSQPGYDKIVSVGMFEHVGESRLPAYFRQAWKMLRPGGVFLNHGIAASANFKRNGESFIDRYVFPDGDLVPLATTIRAAESCGLEVRDVESLREHYARTLRHWVRRLESHHSQARRVTSETVYRVWRIYMSGSAHAFTMGRVNLYQILFSKPDHGDARLPLSRADWYA